MTSSRKSKKTKPSFAERHSVIINGLAVGFAALLITGTAAAMVYLLWPAVVGALLGSQR